MQQSQTHSHSQHYSVPVPGGGFLDRIIGVLTLDVPTYQRIGRDRRGTLQAAAVVGGAAVATAIGQMSQFSWLAVALLGTLVGWVIASGRGFAIVQALTRRSLNRSRAAALHSALDRRQEVVLGFALLSLFLLLILGVSTNGNGWSGETLAVPFISWFAFSTVAWYQTRRTRPDADYASLLRTVGFAHAPGLLAFLGFIPLVGLLVALVVPVWAVLTMVFAIRHTLRLTLDQAMATATIGISATVIGTALLAIFS